MIEKIKLKPMSGFMHGFFDKLPRAILTGLIIILVSLLFAYFSGLKAQKEFNDFFTPEKLQSIEKTLTEETTNGFESTGNETLDSTLKALADAKDWTSDKLADNPLTDAYASLSEQYTSLVEKVTKFGEKTIFWVTFAFSFLFALMILNKVNHFIKTLTNRPDPAMEDNIKAIAKAVNQLIDQQNSQSNLTRPEKLG